MVSPQKRDQHGHELTLSTWPWEGIHITRTSYETGFELKSKFKETTASGLPCQHYVANVNPNQGLCVFVRKSHIACHKVVQNLDPPKVITLIDLCWHIERKFGQQS